MTDSLDPNTANSTSPLWSDVCLLLVLAVFVGCLHHGLRGQRPIFIPPANPEAALLSTIEALELRKALGSSSLLLVDARPTKAYLKETIPGSLSLPLHANWEDTTLEKLKTSSNVVVFCSDERCQASRQVALGLKARGVNAPKVYSGGIKTWKALGYPLEPGKP